MIRAARWTAIAIAVAAAIDPRVSLPRSERPVIRVVSPESRDVGPLFATLKDAGFVFDAASAEAATVLVASRVDERRSLAGKHVLWALDTAPPAPNVSIMRATAPAVRLPGQSVEVRADIAASGTVGQTTDVVLEQAGIPVATTSHTWAKGESRWTASLQYLPPTVAATSLRVRASVASDETSTEDNAADVALPATRGAIRVLIIEAAVTWPAVFVRRALEGEPAIAVSSLQRAAKSVATRAGDPPPVVTRSALAPFEAVVIGGPDELRPGDLDVLRWFVEQRGGVAIFVPDRAPSGRYVELLGVPRFTSRALEAPARLGANLQASELLIATQLPPAATILASADTEPIVFAARRGAGAVVFSGALDAWRQRGDEYGGFWRGLLVAQAAAVPPLLEVTADPAILRAGDRTRIVARMREIPEDQTFALPPISARVVSPDAKVDEAIRMWPTAQPGVYEGEWRGRTAGAYNVSAAAGAWRGDAIVTIAASTLHASSPDSEGLAIAAAASGGRAFPLAEMPALVAAMKQAHPPQRVTRPMHPMRSPWWMVPFAALLCAEWAVRRKRGRP